MKAIALEDLPIAVADGDVQVRLRDEGGLSAEAFQQVIEHIAVSGGRTSASRRSPSRVSASG